MTLASRKSKSNSLDIDRSNLEDDKNTFPKPLRRRVQSFEDFLRNFSWKPKKKLAFKSSAAVQWSPRNDAKAQERKAVAANSVSEFQLPYEFAIVFHNKQEYEGQLITVLQRCIKAGLTLHFMKSTLRTRGYLVVLLKPTEMRLKTELCRLKLERWFETGGLNSTAFGQVPSAELDALLGNLTVLDDEEELLTNAERIQAIARIISSTEDGTDVNPGAGIAINDENREAVISACFPLHNRMQNKYLLGRCHKGWNDFFHAGDFVHEFRYVFGEKLAFHVAFLFTYSKMLAAPAAIGILLYLSLRWTNSVYYMRALSVFGFLVSTLWGATVIKVWRRENQMLKDQWGVRLFKEAEYPNPKFKPTSFRNVMNHRQELLFREPHHSNWARLPAIFRTTVVFLLFLVVYITGTCIFVQWYTTAMLAPVCSECPQCKFLECFDTRRPWVFTWRWIYIFIQGIILGIVLDMFVYVLSNKLLRFFVRYENYPTEAQVERAIINRLFIINWISFFFWFYLIAFVITPFGEAVETWLAYHFNFEPLTVDWQKGEIDMSTALVTPLLITQALNLFLDSLVPYYVRTRIQQKVDHALMENVCQPAETLLSIAELDKGRRPSANLEEAKLPPKKEDLHPSEINIGSMLQRQMISPPQLPAIQEILGVPLSVVDGFENDGFMTADEVVEESRLEVYDTFNDYLRLVIQFGYVVMFSVVWPFCPFAALAHNYLNWFNLPFKICRNRRRPVPRKANSIGQWEEKLLMTLLLGLFMVVGLICLSSGALEYFTPECLTGARVEGDFRMTPDFSCLNITDRVISALVLEHLAIGLVYFLMTSISSTPKTVKIAFYRKKQWIQRAIDRQSSMQSGGATSQEDMV